MVLIDETFKYFKGREKDIKHTRIENADKNQAIATLCEENDTKVERIPPETPKLNMVEYRFAIRYDISKTLMQNADVSRVQRKMIKL